MAPQILNTILGIVLMVLPGVFGFDKEVANIYHILGPLIVMFAFTAIFECTRPVRWANMPLAILLIFSPLFVNSSEGFSVLLSVVIGGLVLLFSLRKGKIKHKFSDGWTELFQ